MPVFLERDVLEAGGNGPSEDVLRFFFHSDHCSGKVGKAQTNSGSVYFSAQDQHFQLISCDDSVLDLFLCLEDHFCVMLPRPPLLLEDLL